MEEIELIPNLVEGSDEEIEYSEMKTNVGIDPALNGTEKMAEIDPLKRIPVTILTGYLGSGKSTLLGGVSKRGGRKIAVILNEFGDTSAIERSLTVKDAKDDQIEEWIDLGNGCLCCTVKDDGVAAIERLVKKKANFDHIILETSGLADPAPIAKMFWMDDSLASNVYIDGVITILDAENVLKTLDEDVARTQIAMGDVIILNKVDKLNGSKNEIHERIQNINPICPIYETEYGNVGVDKILDLHAYAGKDIEQMIEKIKPEHEQQHHHHHHQHSNDNKKGNEMGSVCIDFDKFTNRGALEQFERRLQKVLWEEDDETMEIHRSKGLLFVKEVEKEREDYWVLQGVRSTYEITKGLKGIDELELEKNRIVFIGRGLNREKLIAKLIGQ